MCGIVGGISERNIVPVLIEGLKSLEYRGYDSAGIVVVEQAQLVRDRAVGKVNQLAEQIKQCQLRGALGIAHTRWATHGQPLENNAHPHICESLIAVVHNGIIENYQDLKQQQSAHYRFTSDTDTEVIAHQIHQYFTQSQDLLRAVQQSIRDFKGSYAIAVICKDDPERLIVARQGSPLVIGIGIGEHFIASDVPALLAVTNRFIFLEEGDIAEIKRENLVIYDKHGQAVERPVKTSQWSVNAVERGEYRHYMLKEIHEQPQAIINTLENSITHEDVITECFGVNANSVLQKIKRIQIIACGTSYHAGMVARYWFEDILGIPCQAEVASEFRYRHAIVEADTLLVTISQSGETADTLAALKEVKQQSPDTLALSICNVAESSLVRASDLVFITHAGPEIGVASTKAFTTQLLAFALLLLALSKLPHLLDSILGQEQAIKKLAEYIAEKHHALFLGRGTMYPVAMEGALKLKEISYIHAEAYPAGELKHGPLALVDEDMPVVVVAPNDELIHKLQANLEEVKARNGRLYIFADKDTQLTSTDMMEVLHIGTNVGRLSAPIIFTIPLQLLAYHVAVIKGTDIDQPRNLAKSVTVE